MLFPSSTLDLACVVSVVSAVLLIYLYAPRVMDFLCRTWLAFREDKEFNNVVLVDVNETVCVAKQGDCVHLWGCSHIRRGQHQDSVRNMRMCRDCFGKYTLAAVATKATD